MSASTATATDGMSYLADLDGRLAEDTDAHPLTTDSDVVAERSVQERFEAFHAENPRVYERLHFRALALVESGHARIGIKMLWEVLRYDLLLDHGDNGFKLNNDFTSRYARLLMATDQRLAGVFQTRELRA